MGRERSSYSSSSRMEPLLNAAQRSIPMIAGTGGLAFAAYGVYRYGETALPYYNVIGGQRAVVYSRVSGVQMETKSEGMHFKWPWLERPTIFNVKFEPYLLRTMSGSRDLQMVDMQLRVLCRPDPGRLPQIFREVGADYREKVLPSIVNEVLKAEVARHNATQLIKSREQISQEIKRVLTKRANDFGILVQDVSITHLQFSQTYMASVEAKQVAEQEAMAVKIKAEGEAESAVAIGDAMKDNPGYLQLRRIEAARDISTTISKSANNTYLDAGTLLLNLGGHEDGISGTKSK